MIAKQILLPPMSNTDLKIFYLLTANRSVALISTPTVQATVIPYELFIDISPSFKKRPNLTGHLAVIKPILSMYGFYLTAVTNVGYMCHKSIIHTPDKFDRKFFGAKKIDEMRALNES